MGNSNSDAEKLEAQRAAVIRILYWSMILGIGFLSAKYVLPVAFPFVLAYLVAWALHRPITWFTNKTHIRRGVVATLFILLTTLLLTGLLTLLGASIVSWGKEGLMLLPGFIRRGVFPFVEGFFLHLEELAEAIAPNVGSTLSSTVDALFQGMNDAITHISSSLVSWLGNLLTGVPGLLMRIVITIIASIFISSDFLKIREFLVRLLPEKSRPILREGGLFFGHIVPRFLASYVTILLITFAELWVGLSILRIPKAHFVAFFVAILDILPVLGTGTVLIPWSILSLFSGEVRQGVSMLILYGVITVVRQSIEPRLVGRQIRVHPVLTFAGMLFGVRFFGAVGLFGVPLFFAFLRQLHEKGLIHLPFLDNDPDPSSKEDPLES